MSSIAKLYRNMKFKSKLLLLICLVAIIPTALLFMFSYENTIKSLEQNDAASIERSFAQQAASVSQTIERTTLIPLEMRNNTAISNFFYLTQTERAQDVIHWRLDLNSNLGYILATAPSEIRAIRFYTANAGVFTNKQILKIEDYMSEPYFAQVARTLAGRNITSAYFAHPREFNGVNNQQRDGISIFTKLIDVPTYLTYVEVELSFTRLFSALELTSTQSTSDAYFLIHKDGVIISSDDELLSLLPGDAVESVLLGNAISNRRIDVGGANMMLNAIPLPSIDSALLRTTDMHALNQAHARTRAVFALIFAVGLVVVGLLTNFLVDRLLSRLQAVDHSIRQIRSGDLDVRIDVRGGDEIDRVSENLNYMAMEIQSLLRDAYESDFQMRDLKLRMMARHITPHFLNNTLECLKMRALINDETDVYERLATLSRLMRRYADYDMGKCDLGRELDGVADYVQLMNTIQSVPCELKIDAPDVVRACQIPSFTLQPLVENAIRHGGRNSEGGLHVHIAIEPVSEGLHFSVSDDGEGVDAARLGEVKLGLSEPESSGESPHSVGLFYTSERLKLLYGNSSAISFESIPGEGATVTFFIPWAWEAKDA